MNARGFSLVEAMVAVAVLGSVTVGGMGVANLLTTSVAQSDAKLGQVRLQKDMRDVLMKRATCVGSLVTKTFHEGADGPVAVKLADDTVVSAGENARDQAGYNVRVLGLDFVNKTFVSNLPGGDRIFATELRLNAQTLKTSDQFKFAPSPVATLFLRVNSGNQITDCLNAEDPQSLAQMNCGAIGGAIVGGKCVVMPSLTNVSCSPGQYMQGFSEIGVPTCKPFGGNVIDPPPLNKSLGTGWPATKVVFGVLGACTSGCQARWGPNAYCASGCHQSPLKWTWMECADCQQQP